MSMKTCLKKQVSVLLCFFLLISILTPFPIHGEDDVPTATLSLTYLIKSDQAQTVTMNVRLPATTKCNKFSCTIREGLSWANARGLISGMPDQTLAPQSNAIRCQTAAILHRFHQSVE